MNSNTSQRVHSSKKEKTHKWFTVEVSKKLNNKGFELYFGKWRKSAVKSNPGNVHSSFDKLIEMGKNFVGLKQPKEDKLEGYYSDYYDKRFLLEEFRKVYREFETSKKPKKSVRTDFLAWEEMEKIFGKVLEPVKTIGEVSGVEIGDVFDLRLELIIMGIHFQQIHGIDYTMTCPKKELFATSIVATEGYDDNMIESNVLVYTGEGGNFESGRDKGKNVKDQVLRCGNLALRNSMKARIKVRVVRGLKSNGPKHKSVFVYDGLYTVDDYWATTGICGNKQFQFKLVRCPDQEQIVWAKISRYVEDFKTGY